MKYLTTLCAVTALILVLAASSFADSRDWSLKDARGGTFKMADARNSGKPMLLIFWATFCTPCKKEMSDYKADLDSLVDKGAQIVLISEDTQKSQSKVKPYIDSKGFTWPCLLDPDNQVLKRYGGNEQVPYTVLLNSKGETVETFNTGIKNIKTLKAKIEALISGGKGE